MPNFLTPLSLQRTKLSHPLLQKVILHANTLDIEPFQIACTFRTQIEQMKAFNSGQSKAKWLQSPHNFNPALAFDAVPSPLNWKDLKSFAIMAANIMHAAKDVDVEITWGADWNNNGDINDESFVDRPHFQLTDWKALKNVR